MKIPKQAQREARELLRSCRVDGKLEEGRVRQAVDAVLAGKPRRYLAVLSQFRRLVKLELGRRTAQVESPAPLAAGLQDAYRARLEARYGAGLIFSFAVNPALLGGVRVRVGSDVYDGSVAGRLAMLAEDFEAK